MTIITVEFSKTMTELYAKVSFDSSMSELEKDSLLSDWKEFVNEVNKHLTQVEGIKYE